jgi:hypothetical protein
MHVRFQSEAPTVGLAWRDYLTLDPIIRPQLAGDKPESGRGVSGPLPVGGDARSGISSAASNLKARLLELDLHAIEPVFFLGTRGLIAELTSVLQ